MPVRAGAMSLPSWKDRIADQLALTESLTNDRRFVATMARSSPVGSSTSGPTFGVSRWTPRGRQKPTDDAHIESFNARLTQELLNASWFLSLADARRSHGALEEGVQRGPTTFSTGEPDPTGVHPDPDTRNSHSDWYRIEGKPMGPGTVINVVSFRRVRALSSATVRVHSTGSSPPTKTIDPRPGASRLSSHLEMVFRVRR